MEKAEAKASIIRAKAKDKRLVESLVVRKDQENAKMDPKEKGFNQKVGLQIGATHSQISMESRSG